MKTLFLSMAAVLLGSMAFAESYTLNFVEYSATDKDSTSSYVKSVEAVFGTEATQYVASIDVRDNVSPARQGMGAKFGSQTKKGILNFTLTTPTEVDSIVFSAAMYSDAEGADGFKAINVQTEDTTTFGLSAGNKKLEDCIWKPAGVVTTIRINQTTAANQRFYVKSITIYPKKASDPTAVEAAKAAQDNRIYSIFGSCMGNEWDELPAGVYIQNGKKVSK